MIYRYVNTAMESVSLLICVILLAYQMTERKRVKDSSAKWFTAMIVFNMLMLIGDICDWTLGGVPGKTAYIIQYIFVVIVYFAASGLLLYSLFGWIIANIEQKTKLSPVWKRVGTIFCSIQVLIAITVPIHKSSYIGTDNYYVRGKYFFVTQFFPYLVYFMSILLLILYRKAFLKKELWYLGVFITIPLIAQVIQVLTYKLSALSVAVSLGLIQVLTFIQSQRELANEQKLTANVLDENVKLNELQKFQENLSEQLIEVLSATVEAKDRYTQGHSLRVAQYAREIMYRLGGDERAQQEVYYIGILHDVGKISIKDEIINKKGKLTDREYEQIKLHTIAGYQILRGVDVIPNLAIGARWHHERYDGTGYPNGLAGENIPLIARIISVADAYDAMTSNRSYHDIMPQSVVREEIVKGMGTQFDPKIAKIMLEMIDEDLRYDMKQVNVNKVINILLIDDDEFTHKIVRQVLREENYSLTSAYSGQEGISYMEDNFYDLCLLDMEMPGMNGFEVLSWIHENLRKMRVIFLTGDKDIETIKKSEALGARDYITKPVNVTVLKESIDSVLKH